MIYIRSLLFYFGQFASTIPFFFVSMVALFMPPRTRARMIAGWAHFVTWWLKVTCGLRYEITGLENVPDEPCVFACNHQSTWETIATQTFLPPLAWVLKQELLIIPFFGWGLWASRPIAINRQRRLNALDQVIEQGVKKIAEGRYVLIFPEGTRMPYDQPGKYKQGASRLAAAAGVPIVPIVHNAGRYWSTYSWLIKPGVVKCHIFPAIEVDENNHRQTMQTLRSYLDKVNF